MPKMSGMKLYRQMREHGELGGVPVVIVTAVTGYGSDPEEFRRFLDGRKHLRKAEGFMPKPIDARAYVTLVEQLTAGAA
jgi:CheY-like chemotaxis protein